MGNSEGYFHFLRYRGHSRVSLAGVEGYIFFIWVPKLHTRLLMDNVQSSTQEHISVLFTSCLSQARGLCSENVTIGFKTSIEVYFVEKKIIMMPELLEVGKFRHNF